ncbi:MAG: aminotransferase class I/II-fold pyridoxal phosphate-dependent enzyme [Nanoarchaeota archaeon]|nr:aminotransferase class I/II-fold pyridoxal phosphate-dependent enzyme [Nanoarchaeota archaeon]
MSPELSNHFKNRKPSAIRMAQIEFSKRKDDVKAINTAIGNVSLPMHPAMIERMFNLKAETSPFKEGVVRYSSTRGFEETNNAFLNVIAASGFNVEGLYSQITNGGSQAMGLIVIGTCGPAGSDEKPLLLIDATYTNYSAMAQRYGRRTVSISRHLHEHGKFSLPEISDIKKIIEQHNPCAMVVIPYDNPTGHFYDHKTMISLAKLCVKYDMWMISDEAYRELHYVDHDAVSIWGLTEKEIPGITGRRISIETASKVWNACGLRIGAIVTDNELFSEKAVAENTAELCSPVIDQYIFGSLAHVSKEELQTWFKKQRTYYNSMLSKVTNDLKEELPGLIVSSPDASIYSVVDVRNIAKQGFDAADFVNYCAKEGFVNVGDERLTLLVAPMAGFYTVAKGENNPGTTQMRIAYVETPDNMNLVPKLFSDLFRQYKAGR